MTRHVGLAIQPALKDLGLRKCLGPFRPGLKKCGLKKCLAPFSPAAIDPKRKAKDLSDSETETLASEILRVTRQSYETKGITNDLDRVEQLQRDGLTRSKYRHHVYRRDGLECFRCGNEIERKDLGGRGMFFCPSCQV